MKQQIVELRQTGGWRAALWLLLMILVPGVAPAQRETPTTSTWVTNGSVYSLARTARTIYLGGNFSHVGPYTGGFVPIDATTGKAVGGFPKVAGSVHACVADGKGGWFIGGAFSQVGSLARKNLAHILADGSVDPAWDASANGIQVVNALAVAGDTVCAGGTTYSSPKHLALLDAATGAIKSQPSVDGWVYALAAVGETVYVGGQFTNITSQTCSNLAALNVTSGTATGWHPATDYAVRALLISGNTLYLGGDFTLVNGQARTSVAALDLTSGAVGPLSVTADSVAAALALSGGTLYIGGYFNNLNGQPHHRLAAVDASTGELRPWDPNSDSSVESLMVVNGTVYAGGSFTNIGGQERAHLAALDGITGSASDWNPSVGGYDVNALAASDGKIFAGGYFNIVGGVQRDGLAALDALTGTATEWHPKLLYSYTGTEMGWADRVCVGEGTVYISGHFQVVGGQARNRLAALDAATGAVTAWDPKPVGGGVNVMVISGGTMYVGGQFSKIGGLPRSNIAALDPVTGAATAWDPCALGFFEPPNLKDNWIPPSVNALAVSRGVVYAGGLFKTIGGQARMCLAALDADSGDATDWNPNANYEVDALALSGSTLFAGGHFVSVGGQARNGIAAVSTATGLATDWNPNATTANGAGSVSALTLAGSTLYAAGYFFTIGGQSRNYLAALDTATGQATAWNPTPSYDVYAITVGRGAVYVGGGFVSMGGNLCKGFAQFDGVLAAAPAWRAYE